MMMFISGRGRDDYLSGTTIQPDPSDPRFRNWRAENYLVMSWLINSMTMKIGENFLLYTIANEIWDIARDTFSNSESTVELFHVESILQDITFNFTILTRNWQQLDLFESHEW